MAELRGRVLLPENKAWSAPSFIQIFTTCLGHLANLWRNASFTPRTNFWTKAKILNQYQMVTLSLSHWPVCWVLNVSVGESFSLSHSLLWHLMGCPCKCSVWVPQLIRPHACAEKAWRSQKLELSKKTDHTVTSIAWTAKAQDSHLVSKCNDAMIIWLVSLICFHHFIDVT